MRHRRPREIAPGVYQALGAGLTKTNVYLVRSGDSWVLVDAGWARSAAAIRAAAVAVFGPDARPVAILLTHIHPDHDGAARELARGWGVPVFVHPAEPLGGGPDYPAEYMNPVDRRISAVVHRVLPAGARERMAAEGRDLASLIRPLDPKAAVPGLPGWRCVPTPGHTPGHVSLFRDSDRVLLTGDAVLTLNPNSVRDVLLGRQRLAGPPRWFTWNWAAVTASVQALAALEPRVLASGHGTPMAGATIAASLRDLADKLRKGDARPARGWRARTGLFGPIDYAARVPYRPPPTVYRRLQWLGPILTRLDLSPAYVVTLEVPGRRSGMIRRTTLAQAEHGGERYLVAIAGESQWVRNVRAAGGNVVLARRARRTVRLVEVPPAERAPIIRAYLLRAGRRAGSKLVANEARAFFGVGGDPTLDEISSIAQHYPVFRITEDTHAT